MRLVYLQYAGGSMQCEVVETAPDDVTVDEKNGTWSFGRQTREIGEDRYIERMQRYGIIGVYDADNVEHLSLMVRHACRAVDDTPAWMID